MKEKNITDGWVRERKENIISDPHFLHKIKIGNHRETEHHLSIQLQNLSTRLMSPRLQKKISTSYRQ